MNFECAQEWYEFEPGRWKIVPPIRRRMGRPKKVIIKDQIKIDKMSSFYHKLKMDLVSLNQGRFAQAIKNYGVEGNRTKLMRRKIRELDYTPEQLCRHLESQFKKGMTWKNHQTYWSIDHKIPVSWFHFYDPNDEDYELCWALNNLQPLTIEENQAKGNRYADLDDNVRVNKVDLRWAKLKKFPQLTFLRRRNKSL